MSSGSFFESEFAQYFHPVRPGSGGSGAFVWLLACRPVEISARQLATFRAALGGMTQPDVQHDDARPLQPLQGRVLRMGGL